MLFLCSLEHHGNQGARGTAEEAGHPGVTLWGGGGLGVSSYTDFIFLCSLLFPSVLPVHFLAQFLMGTLSVVQPQVHLSLLGPPL